VTRGAATIVGSILLLAGLGCMVVAFIDFFSSAGSFESPQLFWLWFVGMPLLAAGAVTVGWSKRKGASNRFNQAYSAFGELKSRMDLHVATDEARQLLTTAQQLTSKTASDEGPPVIGLVADEARGIDEAFLSPAAINRMQEELSAVLAEVGPELRAEATTIDEAFTAAASTPLMSDEQVSLLERRVQAFEIQVVQGEAVAQSQLTDLRTAVSSLQEHMAATEQPVAPAG
jgi:hypothetical protein